MLVEFALDPELLGTWGDFRYYVSQFGVSQGRLISEFPSKWKRMVMEIAKKSTRDREFLMLTEALNRLDREMILRDHSYDEQSSWLKNAIEENKLRPFHGIMTTTRQGGASNLIDGKVHDPTKPHKLWTVPRSTQIIRTPTEMANCVKVLLSLSDEVLFIDPYFGPGKRKHLESLEQFVQAILNRGNRRMPTRIEYHGGNQDQDKTTYQQNLEMRIKPYLPVGVALSVVRWRKCQMHNRYILTDRGGVMFGHGLDKDEHDPIQNDTVSLLDDKTCLELMEDYSPQSKKLTWLNEIFSVIGV